MTLVERDLSILRTLTHHVRIVCLPQAKALWWSDSKSEQPARRRLLSLVRSGWLQRHIVNAHILKDVPRPIVVWEPGSCAPDFSALAKICSCRSDAATALEEVFCASPRTTSLMGSMVQGLPLLNQVTLNLRLTSVYLLYTKQRPDLSQSWSLAENLSTTYCGSQPTDACLINQEGVIQRGVVAAGNVRSSGMERIHERYSKLDLPYEIW